MEIKKVIFVNVRDIVVIPSKEEEPRDCTDFQLRIGFVEALKRNGTIVRVNILDFKNDIMTFKDMDERKGMLNVIAHWLFVCTGLAATTFSACTYNGGEEECLKTALNNTHGNDVLGDKSSWLFVGMEEHADKYGIDFIGVRDFINGTDGDIEGTEGGEEKEENKA